MENLRFSIKVWWQFEWKKTSSFFQAFNRCFFRKILLQKLKYFPQSSNSVKPLPVNKTLKTKLTFKDQSFVCGLWTLWNLWSVKTEISWEKKSSTGPFVSHFLLFCANPPPPSQLNPEKIFMRIKINNGNNKIVIHR